MEIWPWMLLFLGLFAFFKLFIQPLLAKNEFSEELSKFKNSKCFPTTLLLYYDSSDFVFSIINAFTLSSQQFTYRWQVDFLLSIVSYSFKSKKNFLEEPMLCKSVEPLDNKIFKCPRLDQEIIVVRASRNQFTVEDVRKFYRMLRNCQLDVDMWPGKVQETCSKAFNDKFGRREMWKCILAAWGLYVGDGKGASVECTGYQVDENVCVVQQLWEVPDNFLYQWYNLPADSPMLVAFVTGKYQDANGWLLLPQVFESLVGLSRLSSAEVTGGWSGFVRSIGRASNWGIDEILTILYSDLKHNVIPKKLKPKCDMNIVAQDSFTLFTGFLGVAVFGAMSLGTAFVAGAAIAAIGGGLSYMSQDSCREDQNK